MWLNEGRMDANKLAELRQLVDEVVHSSTKKEAQLPIRRLEFFASGLKVDLDPYYAGKLGEVISYAKEASGNSRNKDHWISQVEQGWYTFKHGVEDRS